MGGATSRLRVKHVFILAGSETADEATSDNGHRSTWRTKTGQAVCGIRSRRCRKISNALYGEPNIIKAF